MELDEHVSDTNEFAQVNMTRLVDIVLIKQRIHFIFRERFVKVAKKDKHLVAIQLTIAIVIIAAKRFQQHFL